MDSGANFMHWRSVLPMERDVIEALFYLTDFMNYNNLTPGHLFPHTPGHLTLVIRKNI